MFSKQARYFFLVYSATFVIQNICIQTKRKAAFSLLIVNKYYTPKMFLQRIL